jgi:hypothetical protein
VDDAAVAAALGQPAAGAARLCAELEGERLRFEEHGKRQARERPILLKGPE